MISTKDHLETVSKIFTGGLKHVWPHQPHPYFWCGSRSIDIWFAWKIPNLSMYHLLVNTNWDIKRRWNLDSRINSTVKSRWALKVPLAQISHVSLSLFHLILHKVTYIYRMLIIPFWPMVSERCIKSCSKEKALLTLHVTTEHAFHFRTTT